MTTLDDFNLSVALLDDLRSMISQLDPGRRGFRLSGLWHDPSTYHVQMRTPIADTITVSVTSESLRHAARFTAPCCDDDEGDPKQAGLPDADLFHPWRSLVNHVYIRCCARAFRSYRRDIKRCAGGAAKRRGDRKPQTVLRLAAAPNRAFALRLRAHKA